MRESNAELGSRGGGCSAASAWLCACGPGPAMVPGRPRAAVRATAPGSGEGPPCELEAPGSTCLASTRLQACSRSLCGCKDVRGVSKEACDCHYLELPRNPPASSSLSHL